jgi:hypothetical protein
MRYDGACTKVTYDLMEEQSSMALAGRSSGVDRHSSPLTGLQRTGEYLDCLITHLGPVKRSPVPSGYRP